MIEADDLRDALIYGIKDAQRQAQDDMATASRWASEGKLSPDEAHLQRMAALAVDRALGTILDKLIGDWPPSY